MVPVTGLAPVRPCGHKGLSLACLLFHHTGMVRARGFAPPYPLRAAGSKPAASAISPRSHSGDEGNRTPISVALPGIRQHSPEQTNHPHKWTRQDSNQPPPACKAGALPDELQAHGADCRIRTRCLLFTKQPLILMSLTGLHLTRVQHAHLLICVVQKNCTRSVYHKYADLSTQSPRLDSNQHSRGLERRRSSIKLRRESQDCDHDYDTAHA